MKPAGQAPFLVGPPGAGKSRWLAAVRHAPTVSSDEVRERLFAVRGICRAEGDSLLEAGGSAADYERWHGRFDRDVLDVCRELRAEGWVVELGGPVGLRLEAGEPALCILPPSDCTLLARLRQRSSGDRIAQLWLARGGCDLVRQWWTAYRARSWTHGTRSDMQTPWAPVPGACKSSCVDGSQGTHA